MTSQATLAAGVGPSRFEALLAIDPSVLDAIPAAVYLCAADGVIVRFNRRAAELWGRTPTVSAPRRRIMATSSKKNTRNADSPAPSSR